MFGASFDFTCDQSSYSSVEQAAESICLKLDPYSSLGTSRRQLDTEVVEMEDCEVDSQEAKMKKSRLEEPRHLALREPVEPVQDSSTQLEAENAMAINDIRAILGGA
jgi:hypothetical protein